MPAAFTNLFKKSAAAPAQAKAEEKEGGKKRKRNKSGKGIIGHCGGMLVFEHNV